MNLEEQSREEALTLIRDHLMPFLNIMSEEVRFGAFVEEMGCAHNTFQQSFTRLVFKWLYYIADSKYVDGRNEASQKAAKKVVELFGEYGPSLPLI